MMARKVTLIDYGVGNLLNVVRALEHVGADVIIVESGSSELNNAERVVLPGVGAFPDGMREMRSRGFIEPLLEFAAKERPMMGICLGMQMLLESSSEFVDTPGLGLINGTVGLIPRLGSNGKPHKVPHIGWNSLTRPSGAIWEHGILGNLATNAAMYFVHSFMANPDDSGHRLAEYDYDGINVCAAVRKGNLYGCQFHPEKSGKSGLQILENFIHL